MTPKALPSEYRGIIFRSRTEARWAVLFDHLPLRWDYEPEGFGLGAGNYLPDFLLPELDMWFEVKPEETDQSERARFEELCRTSGKRGVIAYGPPTPGRTQCFFFDPTADDWSGPFALMEDRRDASIYWLVSNDRSFGIGGPGTASDHDRSPIVTERMEAAFSAARAERFGQ